MRLFKSIKIGIISILLIFAMTSAYAEDIGVVRAKAGLTQNGQLVISSRFKIDLPSQLKEALQQGVNLNFYLEFQLDSPAYPAYKLKLSNWFGAHASVQYRLSYHPFTDRYRVSIGSLSTDFTSLDSALSAVGAIANWRVLPSKTLSGYEPRDIKAFIRMSLSINDLPKPFQVNALTSSQWHLDTGNVTLSISKER